MPHQFIFSKPIMWRAIKIRIFNSDESLIDEIVATFCENMERRKDEYYKIENGNPSFDSRK